MAEIISCCAYYAECSDAKECIRKYSKYESLRLDNGDNCIYNNKYIKNGRIFYGKNANCINGIKIMEEQK